MDTKLPVYVTTARDRLVAAYKTRRREFDRIVAVTDYDYDVAWAIFAGRVCPELPHSYVLDAVDLARTVLWAESRVARRARVGA